MIIGIVGFAGSGKGTVGDILVNDYGFEKLSFADTVKDATSVIFGWPRALLEGDTDESRKFRETPDPYWTEKFGYQVTPRYMLQLMGTEAGRDVFHQNIWIDALLRRAEGKSKVVVPDTRFPNEIKAIRDNGGFVIRVVRGEEPEWYETARLHNQGSGFDMYKTYPDVHYSEWAWIGQQFDYQISNNGTVLMLEADVKHLLAVFTGPAILEQSTAK